MAVVFLISDDGNISLVGYIDEPLYGVNDVSLKIVDVDFTLHLFLLPEV
jgi:hypothetical protein